MDPTTIEIALKIAVALLLGGAIGWQRERAQKPAGLRTHMLIVLGATMAAEASMLVARQFGGDPTRVASNIIVGIGFLGAGTIMKEGPTVHGLTTAATIWVAGALGLMIGTGFFTGAALLTLATLLVLVVLTRVEALIQGTVRLRRYRVISRDSESVIARVKQALARSARTRGDLELRREGEDRIRLTFDLEDESSAHESLFDDLRRMPDVREVAFD